MAGSNINDIKFDALRTAGYTGASLQDMEYAYYLDTYSTPADFSTLRAQFIADNSIEEWEDEIAFWLAGLSPYSAEATAYFAAMASPPNDTRKGLIDTAILALQANDTWSKLDGLWFLGSHDTDSAKINVKNPGTYTLTETGTLTWVVDRYVVGNGTTGRLGTGFNPTTAVSPNFSLNSGHLAVWSVLDSDQNTLDMANSNCSLQVSNTGNQFTHRINSATSTQTVNSSPTLGLYISNRVDAINQLGYRNTSNFSSAAVAPSALDNSEITICGRISPASFSTRRLLFASLGAGLTPTEVTTLYNALNTYKTAIGA